MIMLDQGFNAWNPGPLAAQQDFAQRRVLPDKLTHALGFGEVGRYKSYTNIVIPLLDFPDELLF